MMSPLTSPGSVYVFALVPTTPLFFFQTYDGEPPPLTGVAVNSTEVPMQIFVPGLATTVTEGVTKPLTVTWAEPELAGGQIPLCTTARK